MLPLLALHSLVSHRGDGLRPELLALLEREADIGLSASIGPERLHPPQDTTCAVEESSTEGARDANVRPGNNLLASTSRAE
jgi:hypothetical protein